jgi:hypothetical protein
LGQRTIFELDSPIVFRDVSRLASAEQTGVDWLAVFLAGPCGVVACGGEQQRGDQQSQPALMSLWHAQKAQV